MSEQIKLCKDCANYVRNPAPFNEHMGFCKAAPVKNYEWGGEDWRHAQAERCDESRCGHVAKWYVVNPPEKPSRFSFQTILDAFQEIYPGTRTRL